MKKISCKMDGYGNQKIVFELYDKTLIEVAVFSHKDEIHFCIPTQVGCAMGCKHCATSYVEPSYIRQISYTEMVELVNTLIGDLSYTEKPWVLSFSGHGEPMQNWECVIRTMEHFRDTFDSFYVTSIGIRNTMDKIVNGKYFPDIYFSIHGASDVERKKVIRFAANKECADLEKIIAFCREYVRLGGRCVWNYMLYEDNIKEESLYNLIDICNGIDFKLEIRFTKYIDICQENGIENIDDEKFESVIEEIESNVSNACVVLRISRLEGIESQIACGQMKASVQEKR